MSIDVTPIGNTGECMEFIEQINKRKVIGGCQMPYEGFLEDLDSTLAHLV
jgi:hypothetical protein